MFKTKLIAVIVVFVTLVSVLAIPASALIGYPMSCVIYYKDENGNTMAPSVSFSENATQPSNTAHYSPKISGYALKNDSDSNVTYSMMNKSFPMSNYIRNGSASYTVIYVKTYTHEVRYLRGDNMVTIGSSARITGKPGTTYSFAAPAITGYTPSKSLISGTIGTSNSSETVYYYPIVYSIIYVGNGGTGVPAGQTKTYGSTITLSTQQPKRNGYTFLGWSTSYSGTVQYLPGSAYAGNKNLNLFAVWRAQQYTIQFDLNGGVGDFPSIQKTHGVPIALPQNMPARSGYVFLGWSTIKSATTGTYARSSTYSANESRTLYAIWEKIPETYTVYYHANGGSGGPSQQVKTEGIALTISSVKPTRKGYTFLGWSVNPTSKTVQYKGGEAYVRDSSITLYAVWVPKTYTVRFDANGGLNAPAAQTKTHDETLILRTEEPTRERYRFLGWSFDVTGNEADYYAGDAYDEEGSRTLYAIWEYINYDLSVSDLRVTPNESKQYDIVSVHVRLDSWDQKNAYSDVPVEIILNGSVIYSQNIDFSVYGINYLDFDLNVGALDGLQTITAWVNRGDYANETRTGNNTVSSTFHVKRVVELVTDYVNPNGDYIEGGEVVSSFYVTNNSPSAIYPSDHMNFIFEVYTESDGIESIVYRDTWADVVVPGNSSNLVYFKWRVPSDTAGTLYWCRGFVNENKAIEEDDVSNNRTEFCRYAVSLAESQTPNTRYEDKAPARYQTNLKTPNVQTGKATWNRWEYVNGAFVLKTYGVQISSGSPTVNPSENCLTASYENGKWSMKSGYGVSLSFHPTVYGVSGCAMPEVGAYTEIQSVFAKVPEYGYSTADNEYRTLENVGDGYRFVVNTDAENKERIHFIPVYITNGNYVLSVTVTQVWTPAGMITAVRNSNTITINGTVYDDFYQG